MSSVWFISNFDLTVRVLVAALLGGLVGFEREWSNHPAGFRTHILVCVGSASIMLLSIYGFSEFANEENVRMDPARLAAQVITGIGFLGAGAILRNGANVTGLTTAASIWAVAAIGLSAGAGSFYLAGLSTFVVLLSLFVLNKLEKLFMKRRRNRDIRILIYDRPGSLGMIANQFEIRNIKINSVKMQSDGENDTRGYAEPVTELLFNIKSKKQENLLQAIENISKIKDVISIDSDTAPKA